MIFIILHFSDRTQLVSARADTAGVHTWLDIGHDKSYDGTKMSYQKRHRGIKMIVASEHQSKLRQKEIQEIDRKASKEHEEAKKNSNFTQTYPKGWQRIRSL